MKVCVVFLGLILLTGFLAVSALSQADEPGWEPPGGGGWGEQHHCEHPQGTPETVGECAAYCPNETQCRICCNRGYMGAGEQGNFELCIGRCDSVWEE